MICLFFDELHKYPRLKRWIKGIYDISPAEAFNRLMTIVGFPEPVLDGDEREVRRWRREPLQRNRYELC